MTKQQQTKIMFPSFGKTMIEHWQAYHDCMAIKAPKNCSATAVAMSRRVMKVWLMMRDEWRRSTLGTNRENVSWNNMPDPHGHSTNHHHADSTLTDGGLQEDFLYTLYMLTWVSPSIVCFRFLCVLSIGHKHLPLNRNPLFKIHFKLMITSKD